MSRYESDPAGLGVGKRFGPLSTGSTTSVSCAVNGIGKWVTEISYEELSVAQAAGFPLDFTIPEGYALISEVYVEVEEAFGVGDTIDVFTSNGDATVLGAPLAVDAVGIVEGTVATRVLDAGDRLYVNAALIDAGTPTEGYVKVVVEFQRV